MKVCASVTQFASFLCVTILLFGCGEPSSEKLFRMVPSSTTSIDFSNVVIENEELNIMKYMYMYNGGGVAIGDINNDGLPDIYFTSNQKENKLYLNKGGLEFEDITKRAGVVGEIGNQKWRTGITLVDINHDGWLDLYACEIDGILNFKGVNKLYINNHDLTFSERAVDFGLNISAYSQHAAFFDYDTDGDLDMFLLNQSIHSPESYKRTEARNNRDSSAGDKLFQNDNGKYTDVSETAGIYGGAMGYGLAVSIGDLNNDQRPDIYVSNDFHENDYLYYNNGDGTFKENIIGSMNHVSTFSMGNEIADFNNDGLLDILSLDMKPSDETVFKRSSGVDPYDIYRYKLNFGYHYQYSRNMLQLNAGHLFGEGEVQFNEIGQLAGVAATDWSWSSLMADLDNDGYKDIFITNGIPHRPNDLDFIKFVSDDVTKSDSLARLSLIDSMPKGLVANVAYQNAGDYKFNDVSAKWGLDLVGVSNGSAYGDLDNDGDQDLIVNNMNAPASVYVNQSMRNDAANFISINLVGDSLNTQGIGSRVTISVGDKKQMQEKYSSRGWLSSTMNDLLFGVGTANKIDSVTVRWSDGRTEIITNCSSNTRLVVHHKNSKANAALKVVPPPGYLENITDRSGILYSHRENSFIDFSVERLIPHLLSREGPLIAVGDINNDGLDDFFVGGAKGQSGEIYMQQKNTATVFKKTRQPVFDLHRECEDVGSLFVDVDGDHDLDLYVVSGGGELDKGILIQDRLYLNNGAGLFTFSQERLPISEENGSCVVSGDFNNDGHPDLFVGGRSVPHEYGLPGVSKVLLNDGKGYFKKAAGMPDAWGRLGMVTDAAWIESERKLIVVGEWMPVTIFDFSTDKVKKTEVDGTVGWWNTVHQDDWDGDGDMDLWVGNLGTNTNLTASRKQPIELYVGDFDGDLNFDPILSYFKNDKRWVYSRFDELTSQMVTVRRKYKTYKQYALDEFGAIFPDNILKKSFHLQCNTLSSIFMRNDSSKQFVISALPVQAQFSPIYSFVSGYFNDDDIKDVLAVGNFDGNHPSIGNSDASFGVFLKGTPAAGFESTDYSASGFAVYGPCRDVKLLKSGSDEPYILVSRNNATMRLFRRKVNK